MRSLRKFSILLATALAAAALHAAPVRDGHVEAELLAEDASIQPGRPFAVGLRMRMDEHWHTYWENPGDSGMATTIEWTLPEGFSAGEIQWPVPERVLTPPLVSYGYEGEILLITEITPPADLATGAPVTLRAHAEWLMCREQCIPGEADLELTLPVSSEPPRPDSKTADLFARARERQPIAPERPWPAVFSAAQNELTLAVDLPPDVELEADGIYFYPTTLEAVAPGADQVTTVQDGRLLLRLTMSEYAEKPPAELAGVLTAANGFPPDHPGRAIRITARPGDVAAVAGGAATGSAPSLARVLPLAFLGGLILNLMPCVFPVLGIKIMGFVNQAGADRRRVTLHGVVFTAGVLVSFWILAAALLALRAGGEQLGWGFQLQSPAFVFALAVILLAFGLNLSGVFEFGLAATGIGGSLQTKGGYAGSFFTGVLATVVATPCAAPFLAPALGAALTLPAASSLTLFTVIAVGLSTPYLVLSAFPNLVRLLPRPGPWMETFKQLMAFPLYATVAFLVWVLAGQVENEDAFLRTLGAFVLIAMALWGYGRWTQHGGTTGRRAFGYAFAALGLAGGLFLGYPRDVADPWQEWRPGMAEQLRDEGRIVYVDFTARWCATCKVNKLTVFSSDEVKEAFARLGVVQLKADWTNRDEEITRALAKFGRSAVPFNLIYAPGREEPIQLPEVLTPGIVLDALREATATGPVAAAP